MAINPFMRQSVFYPNGGGTKIGLPDNSNPVGGGSYEPPTSDGDMGLTPPPAGGPPISTDGPGGTDPSGGGGFMDQLNKWLTGGGDGPLTSNAARLAALATAFNNYRDAGRAIDTSKRAAEIANPFGKYREFYGDRLKSLYDDPTQIENTPGYKFALQQGIGATERANASQGYLGSGKMSTDLMDYAQGLASQTFDKERNALMQMSGAQFNPANAADMLMRGEDTARRSRGDALAALGHLLDPGKSVTNTTNINNGNPNGGGKPTGFKPDPNKVSQTIQRLQQAGMNPRDAATLFRTIMSSTDGLSPSTISTLQDLGISPGDVGAVDYAPGSYDSSGFGGAPGGGGIFDPGDGTSGNPIFDPGWAGRDFTAPPDSFGPTDPFGPDGGGGGGFDFSPDNPISIDDINWDDPSFWDSIDGGFFDP